MSTILLAGAQALGGSAPITVTDAASAHISLFDADGFIITERVGATVLIEIGEAQDYVGWIRDGKLVVLTNTNPHVHITEPGKYVVSKPPTTANIGVSRDGSGGG